MMAVHGAQSPMVSSTLLACVVAQLVLLQSVDSSECLETFSDKENYFPSSVQVSVAPRSQLSKISTIVQTAGLFSIDYGSSFKVITEHMAKEQYVLVQCGAPNVTEAEIDAVAPLPSQQHTRKTFRVPLRQIATESTVQLSYLHELGLADRVEFTSKYAVGPCWQKSKACNGGYEGAWGDAVTKATQDASVDAIFVDCSAAPCSSSSNPKEVHFSASQDPGPLNTAEHIKFMAAFFNKEDQANTIFAKTLRDYNNLIQAPAANAPKVAWIEFAAQSSWSAESFKVSMAGYKTRYITHAGGLNLDVSAMQSSIGSKLVVADVVPGVPLSGQKLTLATSGYSSKSEASTAFFAALADVDVVIDETYAPTPSSYSFSSFLTNFDLTSASALPFIANQKVFRIDGTISSENNLDWFESRLMHPQWVLGDLKDALHGTGGSRKYLRNIAASESPQVITSSSCTTLLPACNDATTSEAIPLLFTPASVSPSMRLAAPLVVVFLLLLAGA